jgi:hypothetical protein
MIPAGVRIHALEAHMCGRWESDLREEGPYPLIGAFGGGVAR